MQKYLTNGGKAIPKLVGFDHATEEEIFTWGPRPEEIVKFVEDYKLKHDIKSTKDEFNKQLHTLYSKSKGKYLEEDLLKSMNSLVV